MVIGRVVQVEALQEPETAVVWNEKRSQRSSDEAAKICKKLVVVARVQCVACFEEQK